jgi:hypothetical protein
VIFLGNTTVAIASLSIGHVADMGDQSTSGMVLQEEPEHRRRPQPRSLDNNPYVLSIRSMRDEVDAAPPRSDGRLYFPIDHALETVPDFECSASSWTREHLIRLQVVVFKDQADELLFPAEWAVRDDDKTIVKMRADGFFAPTKDAVSKREWDTTKPFHNFFLHLLQIQRASRTPSPRSSPKVRTIQHRLVKRTSWAEAFKNAVLIATPASDPDYHQSGLPMSVSSFKADRGPRETSSYVLMHDFLAYIASVELQVWPDYNEWQPTYRPTVVTVLTLAPMPRDSQ